MTNITNKLISESEAKDLCDNYDTREASNSVIIGKDDNRSTWFSIEDLKAYIVFVENEASAKSITVDGIRMYIGAYSNSTTDPIKSKLATIFLAPTSKNSLTGKSNDVLNIKGMNYGNIGNPPNKKYGN